MGLKKLILATLLSGFGMWIVAGVWHNLIMASLYEGIHATHDGIGVLLAAYFVLALIMSYLYPLVYKSGHPLIEGTKLGVVIGVLWVFPHGLAMSGAHGEPILYVFKNTAWHIVEQGLGGMVVGFIYYKLKPQLKTDSPNSNINT